MTQPGQAIARCVYRTCNAMTDTTQPQDLMTPAQALGIIRQVVARPTTQINGLAEAGAIDMALLVIARQCEQQPGD